MAYRTLRGVEFAFLSALIRMLEVPHTLAIYVPMYAVFTSRMACVYNTVK